MEASVAKGLRREESSLAIKSRATRDAEKGDATCRQRQKSPKASRAPATDRSPIEASTGSATATKGRLLPICRGPRAPLCGALALRVTH